MFSAILAGLAAAAVAGAVAVSAPSGTQAQPVRVRVKEVDEPAAKRAGAERRS